MLTKRCAMCGLIKQISEFPVRANNRPRPNAYCKECQRVYSREHYRKNARKHNQRRLANQRRYRVRNRRLMDQHLAERACIDCGEDDPIVLEFDHVRGPKLADVSTLVSRAFPWKRIREEMEKCEVRCANCHRRRTSSQLWRRVCGDGR